MTEEVLDQTTTEQTVQPSETETKVAEKTGVADTQENVETDEQKNERVKREAAEKAEKRSRGVQRRIDELTAEKHAERKRADELQALLARAIGQPQSKVDGPQGEPTREQYPNLDYESFIILRAEWRAEQKAKAIAEAATSTTREEAQKAVAAQEQAAAEREYLARQRETAKTIPDFTETMEEADVEVPGHVYAMIQRMPDGPVVAYHMAKNPELARQFYDNPPYMHGILLGQLSAMLKASAKTSNAPAPGKPVQQRPGSSTEPPSDPEKYFAWAQKHMR